MKLYKFFTVSAFLAAGLLSSCTWELLPDAGDGDQILMLSPALLDTEDGALTTKALSTEDLKDDQFNENKVSRLDVFIFKKADGSFVKDYHISGLTPSMIVHRGGKEGYLLSIDWKKDGLDKNIEYRVYVVANSTNTTITTPLTSGSTITEATLRTLSTTDAAIYKRYKEGAPADDVTYSPSKTFLMNATVDSWIIQNMATQQIGDATVTLRRAAVKLVMDVSLSKKFKDRLAADETEYGTPSWKFVNFNTVTPELPEGDVPSPALLTRGSGDYLQVVPGEEGHFIVTTYAYPQTWTAATASDAAPAILVSYPAVNNATGYVNNHYYYIPLCPKEVTATLRNKMYKVNAIISSYGSFEKLNNDAVNLTYEVKDWTTTSADVDAYALDYLMVTPTRYSFKGGNEGEDLSTTFHYYASGTVSIDGIRAYYKNKTGAETPVTDGFNVGAASNGQIVVTSKVPTNGTFRTIEFTVKGSGGKSEKVIIRHYPADFVTGISGSWSSYSDDNWAEPGKIKTYNASYVGNGSFTYSTGVSHSTGGWWSETVYHPFTAKIWTGTDGQPLNPDGTTGSGFSGVVNNQMYVLQITAANDTYRVGRPTLSEYSRTVYAGNSTKTVKYYASNDNVLSPAFMLASQLGGILSDEPFPDFASSALHCALYKEVDKDNNVYGEWRLPTRQEIQYMIDNQDHNTLVMAEVMVGHYYYTLDGGYADTGKDPTNSRIYTRCVRDLTAEEIAKLNNF